MRWLVIVGGALALVVSSSAQAAVSQDFAVRTTKVQTNGSYGFVMNWHTTDTTGAVPAPVTDIEMRLPAGVQIRPNFLRGRFVCDVAKLAQTRDPATCKSAQLNHVPGTLAMDFRPFTQTPVPASLYVFLAKGSQSGATASLVVLGIPDPSNAFVAANPIIRDTKPILQGNFFKSGGDGFGYRLELPVTLDAPVLVSVRDFQATFDGLSTRAHGKKLFWLSQPSCPRSRKIKFQAKFTYVDNGPITKTVPLNCGQFKRH